MAKRMPVNRSSAANLSSSEISPSFPRKRGSSDFQPTEAKVLGSRFSGNEGEFSKQTLHGHIHVKHGYPFKSEYFSDSGDHIVLTPGNFWESGGFKQQLGKEKFYTGKIPDEYLHKRGDLVVAMTEQTEGLLGSMAFVPEDGRYLHNQRIGKVSAVSGDVCLAFLYYAFRTQSVRTQLSNTASGSKVRHTSPDRIYDVSLSLPTVSNQERIAAALSILDAKIDLNNRINAELEALAKTIYDYWFVQFDFPDANGRPYKSSGGKMVWNDALKREIPAGWGVGSLTDIGTIVGGSTPLTTNPANFGNDMIPWITPKDLSDNRDKKFVARGSVDISEIGKRSASLKLYPGGTVLMSSRAPVGYLAIALNPVTTNQGFKSFVPDKGYGTTFVFYTLARAMPSIIKQASGSTFVEISGGVLKAIPIVLPPAGKAGEFCAALESIIERQKYAEAENRELTQLRDWLLPLLMNGQVRVA